MQVHQKILSLLKIENPFRAVYANAYLPKAMNATWRKQNPGVFLQAVEHLHICLKSSVMVGDKLVDL